MRLITSRHAAILAALVSLIGVVAAPAGAAFPPGYPDVVFGEGGKLDLRLGAFPLAATRSVAPIPGGIAVAVDAGERGAVGPRIAKFTAAAKPVPGFGGGDGVADAPVPAASSVETWWTVAIAVDGAGGVFTLMSEDAFGVGGRAVSRLRPDGTPDAAFGSAGAVVLPRALYATGLTALADGGVAVVGNEGAQPTVMRMTATGAPAPGFGVDGVARPRPGVDAQALAVIPDGPDGLLVGGQVERTADHDRPATFRLTATGAVDRAYGQAGVSALPDGWTIASLARSPDGSVFALEGSFTGDCALYHLSADGIHDTGFRASVEYPRSVGALAVDSAGRAVTSNDGGTGGRAIRRFTATGAADLTFGDGGVLTPAETTYELGVVTSGTDVLFASTAPSIRPPGDPVVGDTTVGAITGGQPDASVGPGGVRVTQLGTATSGTAGAPVVLPDGSITVLGGYRSGNHYTAPATLRLSADGRDPVAEPRVLPSVGRVGAFLEPVQIADGTTILLGTDQAADGQSASVVLGRLGTDGHADPSYGTGGLVRTAIASSAATPPTYGTAIGTGLAVISGVAFDWTIARFTAAGTPEPGFGAAGRIHITSEVPLATTTDVYGRLLVASLATSGGPLVLTLRRLLVSGQPDPTFSADGAVDLSGYSGDRLSGVRLLPQPGGGTLVIGTDGTFGASSVRLTPIDAAGQAGTAAVIPTGSTSPPDVRAAQVDGQGRVLLAGVSMSGYPFLQRLIDTTEGFAPDPDFGTGREAVLVAGGPMAFGGMAVRPDGRIILTGTLTPTDPRWSISQTTAIRERPAENPSPTPPAAPAPPGTTRPPTASPLPIPTAPATSTATPVELSAPTRITRTGLTRGLRVTIRCSTRCRGSLTATIDALTARRLRLPRRRLATVAVATTRGPRTVTARLSTTTLRRLRRLRRTATITIRLSLQDTRRPVARTVRVTP